MRALFSACASLLLALFPTYATGLENVPAPARLIAARPLALPSDSVTMVSRETAGRTPQGFSRAPRAAYLLHEGTQLVREWLEPPLCQDGVWYFMMEQMELDDDGRTLLVTRRRLAHTAPAGSAPGIDGRRDFICKYESDIPCVFRMPKRILRFTMGGKEGERIERCEQLLWSSSAPSAQEWRCIYPIAPVK